MILTSDPKARKAPADKDAQPRSTVDSLFARAVQNRPQALALADAPNRAAITGSAGRSLSYEQADRMVNAIAAQLQQFGLATDSVVGLLLPTATEQALCMLGVLRAGMIPAPIPVGWGRREMSDYVQIIGARALITFTRSGPVDTADLARFVAAESFSVRFVLAFGANPPDGVISIDHLWDEASPEIQPIERPNNPADHVALLTPEAIADGFVAVPRSHSQLLAAGIAAYVSMRPGPTSVIAATLSLDNLAGLATQFVPWLVSSSTLILHPPFAASVFRASLAADRVTHVVAPAIAAISLLGASASELASLKYALWVARRPQDATLAAQIELAGITCLPLFAAGEAGLLPIQTSENGVRMPVGAMNFAPPGDKTAPVITTRIGDSGHLEVTGAMVATHAYPPGIDRGKGAAWRTHDGFVDTGLPAKLDRMSGKAALSGRRDGIVAIGSRNFPEASLRAAYAELGGAIAPIIQDDAVLGQRVAGLIGDGRAAIGLAAKMDEAGLSSLVVPGATRYGGKIPFEDTGPDDAHASEGEKALANVQEELSRMRA